MFSITKGTGFHMQAPNGWVVSVQWGPGTYSDRHKDDLDAVNMLDLMLNRKRATWTSDTAEVAAISPTGEVYEPRGHQTVRETVQLMHDIVMCETSEQVEELLKEEKL